MLRVQEFGQAGERAVLLRDREGRGAAMEAGGGAAEREAQAVQAFVGGVAHRVVAQLGVIAEFCAVDARQALEHRLDLAGPGGVAGAAGVFQLRLERGALALVQAERRGGGGRQAQDFFGKVVEQLGELGVGRGWGRRGSLGRRCVLCQRQAWQRANGAGGKGGQQQVAAGEILGLVAHDILLLFVGNAGKAEFEYDRDDPYRRTDGPTLTISRRPESCQCVL